MAYTVKRTNIKTGNVSYLGSLRPWGWDSFPAFHYQTKEAAEKDMKIAQEKIDTWLICAHDFRLEVAVI